MTLRGEVEHWKAKTETEARKRDRLQEKLAEACEVRDTIEKRLSEALSGHHAACKAETVFDRYAIAAFQELIARFDGYGDTYPPSRIADAAFDYARAAMVRRYEALPLMASFNRNGESARRPDNGLSHSPAEDCPDTELSALDSLRL